MKKYLLIFTAVFVYFVGTSISAAAQCGAEGLDRCCGNPARACKRGDKSGATLSLAAETSIRQRSELVRFQREKVERIRVRRKQLARINTTETSKLLKVIVDNIKNSKTLNLFPVEGFIPGEKQSTYFSLGLDNECGRIEAGAETTKCYVSNGIHFYFDRDGTSDHMYLNVFRVDGDIPGSDGMPQNWKAYGFDWKLSYNEWVKLFKKLGYQTLATEKPSVVERDGGKYFDAELISLVKTPNGLMQITLNFGNGFGKTTAKDRDTLFSIIVDRLN